MPPSRPQNDQDKLVQGWIDTNNVEALSGFLVSNPGLLESNFVFYMDSGYGWGTYMDYTLLQQAVRTNQFDIVKMLIEKGANPNYGGLTITPPIFYAILKEPIFFFLIEKGSLLDVKNMYGDTLKEVIRQERGNPMLTKSVYESVLHRKRKTLRKNRRQSRRK